ncbi:MAG: phage tail protein [Streptosporangiaceae bacterium]
MAEIVGAVVLLSGGAAAATAASAGHESAPSGLTGSIFHGCANLKTGAVNLVLKSGGRCPKGTGAVYWNSALLGTKTNHATTGAATAGCTLGQIVLTAGTIASGETMPADGQSLKISQYTALFVLLGTEYGGNGKTTFDLPDLRNAAPDGLSYSICIFGTYP